MFTCWDGKGGELSSQASKMLYKPLGAVYIDSYKEPLDQWDCWKLFVQLWNYTNSKYQNRIPKIARKAFNIGEVWNPACCHGNKTIKLVLWNTLSRILVQSIKHFWYKLAETSLSYLIKIWLSVHVWPTCNHLTNLDIFKTWISLELKEIFENSKQHFSSHRDYLSMWQNGLNWKDVIFVIAPL